MRRSGRTTRIVDAAIQELFNKGEVIVSDHHYDGRESHILASEFAADTLIMRLKIEHSHVLFKITKDEKIGLCKIKLLE